MKITVERFTSDSDSTISAVYIDGAFQCFGLEDEYREEKIAKETRIPAGKYEVGVRTIGGFHQKYLARFGVDHHGMLQIMEVPNFKDILIHIGNTDEDTSGCLLVGYGAFSKKGKMSIQTSKNAYKEFYEKVIDAALNNNLKIEYIDRDRGNCEKA